MAKKVNKRAPPPPNGVSLSDIEDVDLTDLRVWQ